MITSSSEDKLLNICYDDDIEANRTKNIKEDEADEDTELVNHYGHDHLQDQLFITAIPLIAIDSKEEEVGKGQQENEGGEAGDLFLRKFACGLILGSFFAWPAIRIFFFYLLTRCEPIGNLFFLKHKEQEQEIPNWLMALYYDPPRASTVWRIIFMFENYIVNIIVLFISLKLYLSRDGSSRRYGKLHGVMYSPMIMSMASFLVLVTMRSENFRVELLLIGILLALVGCALGVAVTAANSADIYSAAF